MVQITSYTFSKLLDLSKFKGQKNTLINVDILIKISFIILIYNILYLSLIPKIGIFFSMLLFSSTTCFSLFYSSSTLISIRFHLHIQAPRAPINQDLVFDMFQGNFVGLVYGYATIMPSNLIVPMASHAIKNMVGERFCGDTPHSQNHQRSYKTITICLIFSFQGKKKNVLQNWLMVHPCLASLV